MNMKKTLAITLALMLVLCLTVTGFAQDSPGKITGMAQGLGLGYSATGGDADLGEVYPQDERVEYIYLYDSMFTWEDDSVLPATPTKLTPAQIRAARLEARSNKSTGKVLDSITLNTRESRIEVKFTKEYVGIKELDFDFDVVLSIDGRRQSDYAMNFSGTFCNPVVEVYDNDWEVDISDGSVAHAQEYISRLKLDVGNGVTVSTRLSKDKKVYCTTTMTPDSGDDELMKEHTGIAEVINLRAVGLSGSGTAVKLAPEYSGYHVYGKDLSYLGKGNEELELSEKYYLAAKKLELPDEEPAVSEAPAPAVTQPAAPSEAQSTSNANNNPNTGR